MRYLFLFFTGCLLMLNAIQAKACRCAEHPDLTKEYCKVYDLICQAAVDSVSPCRGGYCYVYLHIDALFKGQSSRKLELRSDCISDCQMNFSRGESWLIYAQYYKYGKAEVNFCSRSRKKISSGDDYFEGQNRMTYVNEIRFLNDTYGIQKTEEKNGSTMPERILIQPTAYWKLWLLLISLVVVYVIFYLVKKMP
jgi:hypothetical protein